MVVAFTNGAKFVQVQFTDTEWETVDWVISTYGPTAFKDMLDGWINSRTAQKADSEKEAVFFAFKNAAKADRDNIINSLKLNGKVK